MTRITVVIEDHGEGIHLGQQLAGGRVVAAMQGDHSGLLGALETAAGCWIYSGVDIDHAEDYERVLAAIAKANGGAP